MGMFDDVRVELPIEGIPDARQRRWQTKSFDEPSMTMYRITEGGRLLRQGEDLNYHGDVWFYDFLNGVAGGLTDVRARFTDGQLVGFEVHHPEKG